jgi:hypothetical protein
MPNALNQNSIAIVFLSVLALFVINSVLRIRNIRDSLSKENSDNKKTHLVFALISHGIIILWMIVIAFLFITTFLAK